MSNKSNGTHLLNGRTIQPRQQKRRISVHFRTRCTALQGATTCKRPTHCDQPCFGRDDVVATDDASAPDRTRGVSVTHHASRNEVFLLWTIGRYESWVLSREPSDKPRGQGIAKIGQAGNAAPKCMDGTGI